MTEHTATQQSETTQAEVLARLEALEAELARLQAQVGRASAGAAGADSDGRSQLTAPEPAASRRDLLRYGAVALGAAAAGLAALPTEAADGGPVLISATNTGTGTTSISSSGAIGFSARATSTTAPGNSFGVIGISDAPFGDGVYGGCSSPAANGVHGVTSVSNGTGSGVLGEAQAATATGVLGRSYSGGNAVRGEIPTGVAANGIAIYGLNNSSYAGPGPGAGGFGVYGLSAKGHGLVGATAAAGGAAVVGATNGVAGAYAAAFYGPVVIGGDFTVFGAKSAAVPHPDGSHRLLYCMESPESWFEDFGDGELVDGKALVTIDPVFEAVADLASYHVFLTEYDDHQLLYVTDRTANGFRVQAKSGAGCGAFSWRLVAKRKDIAGERLAKVTLPAAPQLPTVPPTADLAPHSNGPIRTPIGR